MSNEVETYTNFLFYNSEDGKTTIQVIADADAETIWTTQKGMAQIFGVEVPAISKHLKNIFDSRELDEKAVVSKMEITADDGKKYLTNCYNGRLPGQFVAGDTLPAMGDRSAERVYDKGLRP